jgi:hypothetical protein
MIELTELEWAICMMAVTKCQLLKSYVAELPVTLTSKTFGFASITPYEEETLVQKLYNNAQITWLKENR